VRTVVRGRAAGPALSDSVGGGALSC
jgi:hypothetical protein